METSGSSLNDLIEHYKRERKYGVEPETQLVEKFLVENANKYEFPEATRELLDLLLPIQAFPPLKPLQLIRVLTRSKKLAERLPKRFLEYLNEHLPELLNVPGVLLEALTLHLRFIELDHNLLTDPMFSRVLDVLAAATNSEVIKMVIEITKEMVGFKRTKVLEEIWYVGRMLFALDRLDGVVKVKLVNLLTMLLGCENFSENFRRIHGVSTLIAELKRNQANLMMKIALLNCIQKLLAKAECVYDFKVQGVLSVLEAMLSTSGNFIEVSLIIDISSLLVFDDDLNLKFVDTGLGHVIRLLVRTHPSNHHLLKFEDVQEEHQKQAVRELELLLLRLLRFIFSIEKNRKIFKSIFPPALLGPFIDIGNFVKQLSRYKQLASVYDSLEGDQVVLILDEYEKIEKQQIDRREKKMDMLGSYTLLESVGKGAFGTVFLARKGENRYALKRIALQNNAEQSMRLEEHFKQVKIYKELRHPNIVNYYESFIDRGYLCIVMEFIEGFNLSELLRIQTEKGVPFEQRQVWKIVVSLLSVLKYLHVDKAVIHRDLNPANIMVDNNFNLKLADFGLAKAITQQQQMTNSFVGTLVYSCPEIVSNRAYSEKADIWSFGCVVYELMKLKPPFAGTNPLILAKNIVDTDYEAIPTNSYSETLRNIVKLALHKDQEKRPGVVQLLRLAVEQIVSYADQLKQKQVSLNEQIVYLTKKLNQRRPNNMDETMRQTQLVKIDTESLHKIGEDPLARFLDMIKKISYIANSQTALKSNFKKFLVDLFYNKVIMGQDYKPAQLKNELNSLINLSKQEVQVFNMKFEVKKDVKRNITYEMLYFYIEELYELLRKT